MASPRAAPHNNLNPSGGVKGLGNFKWNSSPILVKIGKSTPDPTPPVRKKKPQTLQPALLKARRCGYRS